MMNNNLQPPSYGAIEDNNVPPPKYEEIFGEGPSSNETTIEMPPPSQNENQQRRWERDPYGRRVGYSLPPVPNQQMRSSEQKRGKNVQIW